MASSLDLSHIIDLSKPSLYYALASIAFNPTWWNVVARNEYRNKSITLFFGGRPRVGCYFLAVAILSLGAFRDNLYRRALRDQPHYSLLREPYTTFVPVALFILGQTLVLTSTWALGITGTFLGDYFGMLMDERVEGFPFNLMENPMYVGSTLCFAAAALWYEKPAGLIITAFVYAAYAIALRFEGPFTTMIYASRSNLNAKDSKLDVKKEL